MGIFDAPTIGVINGEWLSHLFGVLDVLADPSAWDGDETTQHAAGQQIEQFLAWLLTSEAASVSIGDVGLSFSANLDESRLWCDGATYARVDYPELYAALDPAFILDADTFQVPDLRERVPVGVGGVYQVGDTGGASSHILSEAEMPAHSHGGIVGRNAASLKKIHWANILDGANSEAGLGNNYAVVTSSIGGSQPHNNMQPYLVARYWIQAR